MPRAPRGEQFDAAEVCVVHTVQRCVRRAFLAGKDTLTGRDFEPRREWIRRRLEVLAAVFGIDVLTYAILSNHMHLILRTRPDVVQTWSDREVALRWLRLFPGRRLDEYLGEPTVNDVDTLARDEKRIELIRTRLSDISWFMRSVSEPIARMANREDECTGRFWEGRFKAQRIMDEAGLLACSMYVDLNPVRAAMAESPIESVHTSAYDRIRADQGEQVDSAAHETFPIAVESAAEEIRSTPVADRKRNIARRKKQTGRRMPRDAWLAPLTLSERGRPSPKPSQSGVRASDKGFLAMAFGDYLKLLDWTGRQGRKDKRGKIPASVAPILQRLGIEGSMWCDLVWNFRRYFSGVAGSPESLRNSAAESGRHWHRGQRRAATCFASG
jgi:REP element-mobilizing transposase RayT